MVIEKSDLGSSGFTSTLFKAHAWCGTQVSAIREVFGPSVEGVRASLWAYRYGDGHNLSLDLVRASDSRSYSITLQAVGCYDDDEALDPSGDVYVPDLVEALHLAGIILKSLGLTPYVGAGQNEVNAEVLQVPLAEGHTNGPIRLF